MVDSSSFIVSKYNYICTGSTIEYPSNLDCCILLLYTLKWLIYLQRETSILTMKKIFENDTSTDGICEMGNGVMKNESGDGEWVHK